MKKYIITEEQLNKILSEQDQPITKGIALHITDENGEYYESKLMDFNSEEEYNEWKETLDEGVEIIGEMDIEDTELQPMNESIDEKQKGFDILSKMVKKHYPFIISLEPQYKDVYDTTLSIDIHIDLNKFYKITNTRPPEEYLKKDHMLDLLNERGMYLMRYVDREYRDEVLKINDRIIDLMNKYYTMIPDNMKITKFEGRSDASLYRLGGGDDNPFYINWRNEKEPIKLDIDHFYPQVDVDKL